MSSFASIYASLHEQMVSPLLAATDLKDDEVAAIETIRRGLRLRSQTSETFWNDLRQIANGDRNGLSKLLGVRPEVIARWPQTIDHYMKRVKQLDNFSSGQQKPQVIPTGMNQPKVAVNGSMGDYNVNPTGPM